jgi:hypothetical protein
MELARSSWRGAAKLRSRREQRLHEIRSLHRALQLARRRGTDKQEKGHQQAGEGAATSWGSLPLEILETICQSLNLSER